CVPQPFRLEPVRLDVGSVQEVDAELAGEPVPAPPVGDRVFSGLDGPCSSLFELYSRRVSEISQPSGAEASIFVALLAGRSLAWQVAGGMRARWNPLSSPWRRPEQECDILASAARVDPQRGRKGWVWSDVNRGRGAVERGSQRDGRADGGGLHRRALRRRGH